jgi:hypothetical protein
VKHKNNFTRLGENPKKDKINFVVLEFAGLVENIFLSG